MNSIIFCAVVGVFILLGLLEAAYDTRAEKRLAAKEQVASQTKPGA